MNNLPIRAGQCQLAKRRFMFHETRFFAMQHASTWATVKPRLFVGTSSQNTVYRCVALKFFKRTNSGEDNEKIACCMTRQCHARADPHRFKLLFLIRHRHLLLGHACHQKRHIKSPRQITVSHPVCQDIHLIGRQCQTMRQTLLGKVF